MSLFNFSLFGEIILYGFRYHNDNKCHYIVYLLVMKIGQIDSWPLNNTDFNFMGPLIHSFFFNKYIGIFFGDLQQLEEAFPFFKFTLL